jgi:hypothetical protein
MNLAGPHDRTVAWSVRLYVPSDPCNEEVQLYFVKMALQ